MTAGLKSPSSHGTKTSGSLTRPIFEPSRPFPSLESLGFDRGKMNKAIGAFGGTTLDDFTESNQTSWFWHHTKGIDPFGNPKRLITGYYVTAPGGLVACPPDWKRNFLSLLQDEIIQECYSVAHSIPEAVNLLREMAWQKGKQKQCCQL